MAEETNNQIPAIGPEGGIVIYASDDGTIKLDVRIDAQTVWLSQQQIATLYGKAVSTVNEHLKNIFAEKELSEDACVKKFGNSEFQQKAPFFYNLEAIISVGFRVHSKQGTLFRRWAIERLKNYLVKGFDVDAERLKGNGGGQYWYELLNTIKDIRSSEKVLYRQVLDLYATSVDYDASDQETILFFKMVQNKLHYAVHGQTAAEVIFNRADAEKEFMGLTTFHGTHPTKADVVVAKNYLNDTELRKLNNMVSGFFDFAENRALDRIPTTMHDYRIMLDSILSAGGNQVLTDAGSVSAAEARAKALDEYRKYQIRTLTVVERDYIAALEAEANKARHKQVKQ